MTIRSQNNENKAFQERSFNWWLRHIMMPVMLAGIAGLFAIVVVNFSAAGNVQVLEREATLQALSAVDQDTQFASFVATMEALAPDSTVAEVTIEVTRLITITSPPAEPPTPIPAVLIEPPAPNCGFVPAGWSRYNVRRGDTLYSLARRRGTTVAQVRNANCLFGVLKAGEVIWLPSVVEFVEPIVEITAVPPEEESKAEVDVTRVVQDGR